MSKTAKITVPAVVAVCLAILLMLGGCDFGKDYKELYIWRHQSGFSCGELAVGRISYDRLGEQFI